MQNMNVELVAQMFKNYQSNVLFHLEGKNKCGHDFRDLLAKQPYASYGQSAGSCLRRDGEK